MAQTYPGLQNCETLPRRGDAAHLGLVAGINVLFHTVGRYPAMTALSA
jgi:hypothetical protein